MTLSGRNGVILAVAGLAAGLLALLLLTAPSVSGEVGGVVRRVGGVCLQLERWTPFGWRVVGQTHSVDDAKGSVWRTPVARPECADVPERQYMVRVFDRPPGIYRLCGLADDGACLTFRRVVP